MCAGFPDTAEMAQAPWGQIPIARTMWLGLLSNRSVSSSTLLEWLIDVPIFSIIGILTEPTHLRDPCVSVPGMDRDSCRFGSDHHALMSPQAPAVFGPESCVTRTAIFGLVSKSGS